MTRPPPPPPDLEALIAALADEARSRAGSEPPPEPEVLLDYLAGRLAPEDEQRVARQLAADPEASRALLDLADLEAAGAAAGERPADLAARAGWRDFQARLPDAAPRPHRPRPPAWLSGIAAALLMATVGLGSWVVQLQGKLVGLGSRVVQLQGKLGQLQGELDRPVANLPSLDLISGSRAGDEPVIALAPGTPLRLVLDPSSPCPGYAAEIEGPRSGDRQRVEGLKPSEGGQLTLLLRSLEPGEYRLLLTGCSRKLEEDHFRITRP